MVFLLNNQNVLNYLAQQKICTLNERHAVQIESKACKNFNLLIHLPHSDHAGSNQRRLLVKQEPHNRAGETNGDLLNEWQIHQFIQQEVSFAPLRLLISEAVHFNSQHSIIVFNYLSHYSDLDDVYSHSRRFPTAIATALGTTLATLHSATIDRDDYKVKLGELLDGETIEHVPDFGHGLDPITPDIFGTVAADGLKFYELYQRHEPLRQAIAALNEAFEPCCLTHNDLKFNNILLHTDWQSRLVTCENLALGDRPPTEAAIRLIDWEKGAWGDPACDLGSLVANYLKLWLKSLVVSSEVAIEVALRLAATPLETLQPSIVALIRGYLAEFPEILDAFPNFITRVMQFAGLTLIESIQAKLQYQEPFGNTGICMLQVAKTLLCTPERSIATVFGITASELMRTLPRSEFNTVVTPDAIPNSHTSEASFSSTLDHGQAIARQAVAVTPQTTASALHDMVTHIQIQPGYSISHPGYRPLALPEDIVEQFATFPKDFQRNYLKRQLRDYLYDIYFSGEQVSGADFSTVPSPLLKNNTLHGINLDFYEQLQHANRGSGYFDSGWVVLLEATKDGLAVQKNGLTLHVTRDRHLHPSDHGAKTGDSVAIRLPHNRIESGFYSAVGNAGMVPDDAPTIELCFNVSAGGAIVLMRCLTQHLNAISLPFVFKVLFDPDDYQRYDAAILYVEQSHYKTIQPIVEQSYRQAQPHVQPAVPCFTKPLAPGLGLAEEPNTDPKDFGIHRCQIVADALLTVWEQGETAPDVRMKAIQHCFALHDIDWQHPYLNPGSEDHYTSLEI
ncbi:phosphotransferase [Oculatella sp. LEGE 06141]|uniref:T3SS effector HopA1 family protein n=1 Tax=Oculatella sp. LEGE 06141 TaxID=1828648 RepID=UPI00188281CB|nr:T3SS effector HopA1 family protein [Oculatella sp. LEGE 06141]MBE9180900.1 phosphotransferase [Oculatella sp. LEGE 06141]